MASEKELKAKWLRELVELIYAWKEANMKSFDEEQNRELGCSAYRDALRDAATRREGELSPIELVLLDRGYKQTEKE